MSKSANVRSIEALEQLRVSLARFTGEAHNPLNATVIEIRRTLEALNERLRYCYWQRQVEHREEIVMQARANLIHCQNSVFYDPYTGYPFYPDCSIQASTKPSKDRTRYR